MLAGKDWKDFQSCLAHFCPVAFFRQMIALKITLKIVYIALLLRAIGARYFK
jgi:hypothetical protein